MMTPKFVLLVCRVMHYLMAPVINVKVIAHARIMVIPVNSRAACQAIKSSRIKMELRPVKKSQDVTKNVPPAEWPEARECASLVLKATREDFSTQMKYTVLSQLL